MTQRRAASGALAGGAGAALLEAAVRGPQGADGLHGLAAQRLENEGRAPAHVDQRPRGGRVHGRARARTPAGLLPAGVLARVLGSSRAGYFTLNVRHFVLAAVCAAVLAIVARMR